MPYAGEEFMTGTIPVNHEAPTFFRSGLRVKLEVYSASAAREGRWTLQTGLCSDDHLRHRITL
jgi:hypothetical protein